MAAGGLGGSLAVSPDFTGDGLPDILFGNGDVREPTTFSCYAARGLAGLMVGGSLATGTIGGGDAGADDVSGVYPVQPEGPWLPGHGLTLEVDYQDNDETLLSCGVPNTLGDDVPFFDDMDGDGCRSSRCLLRATATPTTGRVPRAVL